MEEPWSVDGGSSFFFQNKEKGGGLRAVVGGVGALVVSVRECGYAGKREEEKKRSESGTA